MAFSVQDFQDLVSLLEEHPKWRSEMRRLILTEEMVDIPRALERLTEAQEATQHSLDSPGQGDPRNR
ncbi:MAG: hypothetical protein HC802_08415 [Caldilineaceae bacterium]|nr:hypothetical protein [Caldilineaceae bacterium]